MESQPHLKILNSGICFFLYVPVNSFFSQVRTFLSGNSGIILKTFTQEVIMVLS